jgi:hypothetical protein
MEDLGFTGEAATAGRAATVLWDPPGLGIESGGSAGAATPWKTGRIVSTAINGNRHMGGSLPAPRFVAMAITTPLVPVSRGACANFRL